MTAAALLYRSGRVRHLLLSGDNGTRGYDEPADMQAALLALGVPADAMTLDDAGFRTLDSVVRAGGEVFGQRRLTIITDRFHAYRAVFLTRQAGIDAVAFPVRRGGPARFRPVAGARGSGGREGVPGRVRAAHATPVPRRPDPGAGGRGVERLSVPMLN